MHKIEQLNPQLPGWTTNKKAMALYSLVVTYKPKLSLDIGIFGGRSTMALAIAHQEINHGFVVGVDPWTAEASLEGENDPANNEYWGPLHQKEDGTWVGMNYDKLYRDFTIQILAHDLTPYTNILRMKSEEAIKLFQNRKIGVFHLDGNHSELKSCLDVELWAPLIEENGFWVFDDSNWPTTQAAQKLLLEYGFQERNRVEETVEDGGKIEWAIYQKIKNDSE